MTYIRIVIAFMIIFLSSQTINSHNDTVHFTSNKKISYFSAPLTKKILSSWIDVQKGRYPKITPINEKINIGEDITLLIYFRDPSNKYDISVSDCWAYDNENYKETKNKLNLNKAIKGTQQWTKLNYPQGFNITSVLYSSFASFKFPDADEVYLTCNIKLCYGKCQKRGTT